MLRSEALDVLALRPTATAEEIKEAYRDLVKVWHPDRFGSDPRLRRKAGEKLQEINQAYRVLQSGVETDARYGAPSKNVNAKQGEPAAGRRRPPFVYLINEIKRNKIVAVGFSGAIAGICVVIVWALLHEPSQPGDREIPPTRVEAPIISSPAAPAPKQEPDALSKSLKHPRPAKSTQFHVRHLSDTEVAQLESSCPKGRMDEAAYQDCVREQLDPPAPNLSALREADRTGIESACAHAKQRDGLAAYNRCLTRMVKLLEKSR